MRRLALGLLLALAPQGEAARAEPAAEAPHRIRLSGFIKTFFLALEPPEITGLDATENQPAEGLAQAKLRLELRNAAEARTQIELAYELIPVVKGDAMASTPALRTEAIATPYRVADLDPTLYPQPGDTVGSFTLGQNLDRLMATVSGKKYRLSLGRQPIAFGAARLINPTDVILPQGFNELDTEHRRGVDAVRLKRSLGPMGELEAGAVIGDEGKAAESAAFVRAGYPMGRSQFSLMTAAFRENLLAGGDWTAAVGGAGVWAEAAYVWAELFGEAVPAEDFFRASAGADFNLPYGDGIYGFVEYHYNGASGGCPADYLAQTSEAGYQSGAVYLLGTHYLGAGVSWPATPLLGLGTTALINLGDGSWYLAPTVEYNFSENVYLAGGANLAEGRVARWSGTTIEPQSEFGLYPSFYYAAVRIYF